jgi:DNA-binding NtrC family response regulator
MDGYKLASAIRKRYPEMPVIFMTAFAGEDASGLSDAIGDIPRLTKPFPVIDLVRLLHDREKEMRGKNAQEAGPFRILLFDEGKRGEIVAGRLRSMGFEVERSAPGAETESAVEWEGIDLVAMDERVLEGGSWTLLNRIDQAAPRKPVLLISGQGKPRRSDRRRDADVAVIPREILFRESDEARGFILSIIKSE